MGEADTNSMITFKLLEINFEKGTYATQVDVKRTNGKSTYILITKLNEEVKVSEDMINGDE